MSNTLRKELDNLKMTDTFSLILFVLYKIRDVKEYSTLSELAYILDKDALLNLCEYFGGMSIKIPTIEIPKIEFPNLGFTKAFKKNMKTYMARLKSEIEAAKKNIEDAQKQIDYYENIL